MYYIIENNSLSKYRKFLVQAFNKVTLEKNIIKIAPLPELKNKIIKDNHFIIKENDIEKRKRKITKIAKKVTKLLSKANSKKIVLSKKLKKEKTFKNYLYSQNFNIINGNFLFPLLAPEALEYIIKKIKIKDENFKIAILANNINEVVWGNINKFVREYKNITIVTRHALRLRKLQKKLYEEEGIVVAVTNNKRKSLSKINIILNFDFPEELLNKYSIYENANIINFSNNVKIYKKRFNGVNINDYEIKCKNESLENIVEFNKELIDKNYVKDVYEAQLYERQNFNKLREKILKDEVNIKYLIGNKTRI